VDNETDTLFGPDAAVEPGAGGTGARGADAPPRARGAAGRGGPAQPKGTAGRDGGEREEATPASSDARPLAARVRPRRLEEVVGQTHLLGATSALRTAIEQGHPHSMILYGPPGSGKTTLARMVAEHSRAVFEELSAVQAGRAEVRAVLERAAHRQQTRGARTVFFLDEIHRFNKRCSTVTMAGGRADP
jgi:ABC-type glutathione transport system ATPase component